ncbi:hypothetical protein ZWY2020_058950 [Hordeum vulgare]|nr:hypothetical protein ZWY2020_058950 [Hordeum vulgare]
MNSLLLLSNLNHVVIIAACVSSYTYVFDSGNAGASGTADVAETLGKASRKLEEFIKQDALETAGNGTVADGGAASLFSSALSLALCYIQRIFRPGTRHLQPRMYRVGSADQGSNVGLSLNEIARAYEKKDFTGSTIDESNNCKIPLATLKGKQPAEEQVVYRDIYCDSKNVEVEGVQVIGFTGTRETDNNNIREVGRIEGGNNVREVVMDWTSSSDGAPTADKQASCSSSIRNELIPGHERDDISSDNNDDPNGDTLDSIDIGKATQEDKEMDDMFKGCAFPSIEEVTQAREPEDGLHFKTRDDAFFFFYTYARKIGFSVK